jgi:hypothetical protein
VADLYKGEYNGLPDRDVRTIRDLIHYEYAKIIARSAFSVPDGTAAKGSYYGFIKQTFRELQTGKKSWSEITREDWQFVQSEQRCIYCGSEIGLTKEHIVPRSISINDGCPACEKIQGIHDQIWACKLCNSAKGDRGLYSAWKTEFVTAVNNVPQPRVVNNVLHESGVCHSSQQPPPTESTLYAA